MQRRGVGRLTVRGEWREDTGGARPSEEAVPRPAAGTAFVSGASASGAATAPKAGPQRAAPNAPPPTRRSQRAAPTRRPQTAPKTSLQARPTCRAVTRSQTKTPPQLEPEYTYRCPVEWAGLKYARMRVCSTRWPR